MPRVDNLPFSQPLRAEFTHPSPHVVSAYKICYLAEGVVNPIQNPLSFFAQDETMKLKLINIRILGYLLSQSGFLSDRAISEIARSIISCRGDPAGTDETDAEALNMLGEFYMNNFLRPLFKDQPLRSPDSDLSSTSSGVSTPLADSEASIQLELTGVEVDQMLAETPKSRTISRQLAMQREDHRCIVTRVLDRQFAQDLRPLTGEVHKDVVASLVVCHIFEGPTDANIEGTGKENKGDDDGGNLWTLLRSLGYTEIVDDFVGPADKVHSLDNVMMMLRDLRIHFDRLSMWFEPIEDVCNRYRVCSPWVLPYGLVAGQGVTFESTDPDRLPLPNREYLRIHAACCRVAHLSGACLIFDQLERDLDSDPEPE
ncbi:hypothetical protein V8D89_010193 [Ganoderma adspersum]